MNSKETRATCYFPSMSCLLIFVATCGMVPGDILATGTPPGVGMGKNPEHRAHPKPTESIGALLTCGFSVQLFLFNRRLIISVGAALCCRKTMRPGTITVISVPEVAELTIVSLPSM